ncbi:pyridoxamine 5'-phosphate oxidase family protein [Salinarimonas ramus]|uniref:Pyridoxamine 5'-phosphate oxidase n=1 Tax=Salinarimonas ramus TaxID=690164 RepID=A0A917QK10_9HYPH|nr:pyridoxamine 5'-phosphate oxidase family protein [Salinarimonas ramus]GGK54398.1 pyridoxamine 5'-phosphate oxidase [Salinarimonas ramus]
MPDPRETPAFANDLDEMLAHAWRQLARGVKDRHSPFHCPSVATIGLDGRPRLRTVVLRGVEPSAARLRFHTDRRAFKVAEIAVDPRVALHAYDPAGKLQVRIEGRARVHATDAVAEDAWTGSRMASRACYATTPSPGEVIPAPDAFTLPQSDAEILAGRPHFTAVIVEIDTIETLWLAHSGHRRARFDLATGEGAWLVP